jgi:hypothetical protein
MVNDKAAQKMLGFMLPNGQKFPPNQAGGILLSI